MLQVELKSFVSDALEDAMRLAQTKAINSYSWSDQLNYLNYTWSDLYNRIAMIDEGYYSTTVRLNTIMTKIPPFVKNTVRVYGAQDPIGFNRDIFRSSGMADMRSQSTYHISGFDLYCPDATRRTVWLNFVPIAPMLFFTRNNRDPKLYEEKDEPKDTEGKTLWPVTGSKTYSDDYNLHHLIREIEGIPGLWLQHKNIGLNDRHLKNQKTGDIYYNRFQFDLYQAIRRNDDFEIVYVTCDFPYIFVTYKHKYTEKYMSGFYRDIIHDVEFNEYNPFEFTGRDSNVEYLQCKWNDKTGLGVIVRDWNDFDTKENRHRIKELGWTPDTVLSYPCPEMYRYLVARLADKFSAFNESEVMGVSKELVEARYAFEAFCARDKSAWGRIDNVNGPTIGDWL